MRMSARVAPTARRRPISCVRSRTDISILAGETEIGSVLGVLPNFLGFQHQIDVSRVFAINRNADAAQVAGRQTLGDFLERFATIGGPVQT